jgi:hypothetical protein
VTSTPGLGLDRSFDGSYRLLSYGFRIRTDLADVGTRLDELLQGFRVPVPIGEPTYRIMARPDGVHEVLLDGECVQRSEAPDVLIDYILWDVSARAVQEEHGFLALHAGAVAYRGSGVLLPAPADSGKTTLSAALTRAGFEYLSDEAALIDPADGRVHSFPRPLWMERPTVEKFPDLLERRPGAARSQYPVLAEELRPDSVGGPCPVRFVVAPAYSPEATTELEPMSRAEAVVLLWENSFNLSGFGRAGVELLAAVVRGAACYRLRMGDLDEAVRLVRRALEATEGSENENDWQSAERE